MDTFESSTIESAVRPPDDPTKIIAKGRTQPGATVTVCLYRVGTTEPVATATPTADANGDWTVTFTGTDPSAAYEVEVKFDDEGESILVEAAATTPLSITAGPAAGNGGGFVLTGRCPEVQLPHVKWVGESITVTSASVWWRAGDPAGVNYKYLGSRQLTVARSDGNGLWQAEVKAEPQGEVTGDSGPGVVLSALCGSMASRAMAVPARGGWTVVPLDAKHLRGLSD